MITKGVKAATGCLSLLLGASLSFFISLSEIERASSGYGWSYLAPGWRILNPGAHDGAVMLLATMLDAGIFSIIIFAACDGFVKVIDKLTQ